MKGLHAVYRFVLRYRILHIIFWTWATVSLAHVLRQRRGGGFLENLEDAFLSEVFQILCVYFTIYFLVPRFFNRGRYGLFFLFAFLTIISTSWLSALADDWHAFATEGKHIKSYTIKTISQVFDVTVVTAFFVAVVVVQKRLDADRRAKQREREQMRAELLFLKAQINPHFLFNTINNIYVLVQEDRKTGNEMLLRFSELLRYQLYECSEERVFISQEIRFIRNFIEMEKLRVGDAVEVDVQIADEHGHFEIAPFILLPFVENAFKHVSRYDRLKNFIRISSEVSDNVLRFFVSNTFDESTVSAQPGGIGLQNVRRRLELIYPQQHNLATRTDGDVHTLDFSLHVR